MSEKQKQQKKPLNKNKKTPYLAIVKKVRKSFWIRPLIWIYSKLMGSILGQDPPSI